MPDARRDRIDRLGRNFVRITGIRLRPIDRPHQAVKTPGGIFTPESPQPNVYQGIRIAERKNENHKGGATCLVWPGASYTLASLIARVREAHELFEQL